MSEPVSHVVMMVESQADWPCQVTFLRGNMNMIAFEVEKNGELVGTLQAIGEHIAMMQFVAFNPPGQVAMVGGEATADGTQGISIDDRLNIGDIVTIRIVNTDEEDPLDSGVPILRRPPELPPGRSLFSN